MDVVGRGYEPCPESGDGRSVEGEKMPEREWVGWMPDRLEGRLG